MKRNSLALLAVLTLLLFGMGTGLNGTARADQGAAARAESPFAAFAIGQQSGEPGPKAGDNTADPTQAFAEKVNFPVGAGTGGGDMIEIEPNDSHTSANVAHDVPFNCTGTISYGGDWDWLAVTVTAGQPLHVNAFSALVGGISSPLDPCLYAFTQDGTTIAYDDDIAFPANLNSQINFIAPYTGTIYFAVRSAITVGGPGYFYVLSVVVTPGDAFAAPNWEAEPNDAQSVADQVIVPGVKMGVVNAPGDVDYTYFDAPGGATVVVDVSAHVFGFDVDPLVRLYDSSGHVLFASDDIDNVDPRFNVVVPYTGRFYLAVTDYRGVGGFFHAYVLNVTFEDGAASPYITKLKLAPGDKLKKVMGYGFVPGNSAVEVNGSVVPSVPSAPKPTTLIKVKPPVPVTSGFFVTVVNANGRRSNPTRVE
jgi:hypothetical protein